MRGRASFASCAGVTLALVLGACASHDTTPNVNLDGTSTSPQPQAPFVGDYPEGPYGLAVGNVFPPITVQGYVGGRAPWATISLKDYFDVDGKKGIFGVYVTVSAPWCAGCVLEGQQLPALWNNQYKKRGARLLTVLLQGSAHEAATQATVDAWIASFGTPYDVGMGDGRSLLPPKPASGPSPSLPYNYAINPRTMRVAQINTGDYFHGDALPGLDVVLATNGAP